MGYSQPWPWYVYPQIALVILCVFAMIGACAWAGRQYFKD